MCVTLELAASSEDELSCSNLEVAPFHSSHLRFKFGPWKICLSVCVGVFDWLSTAMQFILSAVKASCVHPAYQ